MTDDLTAAVARLREDACTPAKVPEKDHVVLVRTADIRTVLAALAAAQADARRYRWLRDGDGPRSSRWSRWRIEHWASPGPTWDDIRGADLDAAIDARLKGKP